MSIAKMREEIAVLARHLLLEAAIRDAETRHFSYGSERDAVKAAAGREDPSHLEKVREIVQRRGSE
jgi:hypothetical protein